MKIIRIKTATALKLYSAQISELALNVVSSNIFYESWMLLPAMELLKNNEATVILVSSEDERVLYGVFPLEIRNKYRFLPLRYYSMLRHSHCYSTTPLVRSGREQECLNVFFDWLSGDSLGKYVFQFDHMVAEGSLYTHLNTFIAEAGLKTDLIETYSRPALRSILDAEGYLRLAMSSKHRKDLLGKLKRLEQHGEIRYEILTDVTSVEAWINSFLRLEQAGWKGRTDTAMNNRADQARFFHEIIVNAFHEQKLLFLQMTLEGKAIAMRCGFKSGEGVFSFKNAYDESLAKYSPGVLLELEHIRLIQGQHQIKWVDSCSMPGNVMLGRIWKQERPICSMVVSSKHKISKCLVSCMSQLKNLKSTCRTVALRPRAQPETVSEVPSQIAC